MGAEVGLFCGIKPRFKLPLIKPFSPAFQPHDAIYVSMKRSARGEFKISANLGGGDGELKKGGKKKFITKEEEPEQYWQTAGEREAKGWAEFSQNVSGEWDGFGADFTVEGKPIELPESVVPEAYREWEVKVFDWQTQCPTLATFRDNFPSLMYNTIKLLPTVGCEADAATRYSIQERNVTPAHDSPFAYQSNGCYAAVWPVADQLELEHCLVDPKDKESRVRIIQVVQVKDSELKLRSMKVFVEQWYGPFRNGDQLGGCAIRDSAFAATQPLNASRVAGVWQGLSVVASFRTSENMIQQLRDERIRKSIRDEGDLIVLPKQLWCSVTKKGEDFDTCCEVGWLLDEGRAITSTCTFSSTGELKEIAMGIETAALVQ